MRPFLSNRNLPSISSVWIGETRLSVVKAMNWRTELRSVPDFISRLSVLSPSLRFSVRPGRQESASGGSGSTVRRRSRLRHARPLQRHRDRLLPVLDAQPADYDVRTGRQVPLEPVRPHEGKRPFRDGILGDPNGCRTTK